MSESNTLTEDSGLLPAVILGTMTIGGQTSEKDAVAMIDDFCNNTQWSSAVGSSPMLDTAIMYQGGKTEEILGHVLNESKSLSKCLIATKANPFTPDKSLSRTGVRLQLESSLASLQMESVDLFYLHAPDVNHPIEETLEQVQAMYTEGKFRRFGLSNFTAWETVYIHFYMSSRDGYVVPTVYQGMYNAITRKVETDLFPALRKCNIQFYAYNPLAGGMLSGKYSTSTDNAKHIGPNTRFAGSSFWAKRYRDRYQQPEQFQALEIIQAAMETEGLSDMADVSLRWLRHHSQLSQNDGIIMGASSLEHYNANLKSLDR